MIRVAITTAYHAICAPCPWMRLCGRFIAGTTASGSYTPRGALSFRASGPAEWAPCFRGRRVLGWAKLLKPEAVWVGWLRAGSAVAWSPPVPLLARAAGPFSAELRFSPSGLSSCSWSRFCLFSHNVGSIPS